MFRKASLQSIPICLSATSSISFSYGLWKQPKSIIIPLNFLDFNLNALLFIFKAIQLFSK